MFEPMSPTPYIFVLEGGEICSLGVLSLSYARAACGDLTGVVLLLLSPG